MRKGEGRRGSRRTGHWPVTRRQCCSEEVVAACCAWPEDGGGQEGQKDKGGLKHVIEGGENI